MIEQDQINKIKFYYPKLGPLTTKEYVAASSVTKILLIAHNVDVSSLEIHRDGQAYSGNINDVNIGDDVVLEGLFSNKDNISKEGKFMLHGISDVYYNEDTMQFFIADAKCCITNFSCFKEMVILQSIIAEKKLTWLTKENLHTMLSEVTYSVFETVRAELEAEKQKARITEQRADWDLPPLFL